MNKESFLKTDQEAFWVGKFGEDYIGRNDNKKIIASNLSLFSKILSKTKNIKNVLELGANIGMNLSAIKSLLPEVEMSAIEINKKAVEVLRGMNGVKVYNESILNFKKELFSDFVLSKGVLIHINPNFLNEVYDLMYRISKKYICIVEYYNPSPVSIEYRGNKNKLFKRDFAGEILDRFGNNISLIDYGFIYHRDNNFSGDDFTWFLLKKN